MHRHEGFAQHSRRGIKVPKNPFYTGGDPNAQMIRETLFPTPRPKVYAPQMFTPSSDVPYNRDKWLTVVPGEGITEELEEDAAPIRGLQQSLQSSQPSVGYPRDFAPAAPDPGVINRLQQEQTGPRGINRDVAQMRPDILLPFLAGRQGESQEFLDLAHEKLGGGEAYQQQTQALQEYDKAQRGAQLAGFESPQEASRYAREATAREAEIPLLQQQAQSEGALGVAREQQRGALDVERERQRGAESQSQNLLNLYQFLSPSSGVAGMTLPKGGGSIRFQTQQRTPAPLLRDVTASRNALEAARGKAFGPFGGSAVSQAEAQYRQALGAAFGQDPADAEIKEVAMAIATHPELSNLGINELFTHPKFQEMFDIDVNETFSDEDVNNLDRLLNYARGVTGEDF